MGKVKRIESVTRPAGDQILTVAGQHIKTVSEFNKLVKRPAVTTSNVAGPAKNNFFGGMHHKNRHSVVED